MQCNDQDTPEVVVAALTYRRPQDLAALLPLLVRQADDAPAAVSVLIVDNDPEGGARAQVEAFGHGVRYRHVPQPGIAEARNRALESATDADLLVFIDDDERPSDHWLEQLLQTWQQTRPAAVLGPVVSTYEVEPDRWVAAGRFFERRRMPTGTETDIGATNNLLLDMRFVHRNGLCFDPRFGLTGGSDSLFTRQLHRAGGRIVWCDEAIVTDVVPAGRVTRQWVLRKAYRIGNSTTLISIALATSAGERLGARLHAVLRGVPRVLVGAGTLAAGTALRRLDLQARGTRVVVRGAGMLAGTLGLAYVEYRR